MALRPAVLPREGSIAPGELQPSWGAGNSPAPFAAAVRSPQGLIPSGLSIICLLSEMELEGQVTDSH